MKIKTTDLIGHQLDWAVFHSDKIKAGFTDENKALLLRTYKPSVDWSQGGPIIERERITLLPALGNGVFMGKPVSGSRWLARCPNYFNEIGETPLIAAMRAFVASKLGDEVEIPYVKI